LVIFNKRIGMIGCLSAYTEFVPFEVPVLKSKGRSRKPWGECVRHDLCPTHASMTKRTKKL